MTQPKAAKPAPPPEPSTLSLQPDDIRKLLADQPEVIEEGLVVHTDAEGYASGVRYSTEIGRIDLLARDDADCARVLVGARVPHHADRLHRQQHGEVLPQILVQILRLDLEEASHVVDLGAGTGDFPLRLGARPERPPPLARPDLF